ESYIQDQLGLRFFNAERTSRWAQQRLGELAAQAQAATKEVESYRSTSGITVDPDGKTVEERELERHTAELDRARASRAAAQQRAAQVRSALDQSGDGSTMPDTGALRALNSPTLAGLLREAQASTSGSGDGSADSADSELRQQISAELGRLDA